MAFFLFRFSRIDILENKVICSWLIWYSRVYKFRKYKKKIENFVDPFDRNKKLKKVSLDDKYPKYITENVKRFADIIS